MAVARAHALSQLLVAAVAGVVPERHAPPEPPLSLWIPSSSSALSLPRSTTSTRERRRAPPGPSSTPHLADASRGTAITLCIVCTNPFDRGSPVASSRSSSPTFGRWRTFEDSRAPAPPGLAVASTGSAVSSSSISPPPRARSRTLAALFTGAVSSSPPAMTRTRPEPPELATEHGNVLHTSPGA